VHDVETYETMRELLHMRRIIGTGEEDGKKFSLTIFLPRWKNNWLFEGREG
jgi:hypothetical protein